MLNTRKKARLMENRKLGKRYAKKKKKRKPKKFWPVHRKKANRKPLTLDLLDKGFSI